MYVRYDRKKLCNMPCVEAGRGGPAVPSMHPSFFTFYPHLTTHRHSRQTWVFIIYLFRLAACALREDKIARPRGKAQERRVSTRRAGAAGHMAATAARRWARASCGGCKCTEGSCARQSRAGVWPAPTRSGRACDGALPAPHESQVGGSLAFCESESRRPDPEEWQQRVAFRE